MSRKRELAYILNKYGRLYHGEGGMNYFPETFLLPEQLEDYKRTHKVIYFLLRNIKTESTSARLTKVARVLESRCFTRQQT